MSFLTANVAGGAGAGGTTGGAGTVLQAFGAFRQGEADRAAYEYNARVADLNANIVHADTIEQVNRERQLVRRQLATARANAGANGIAMSGSAVLALADSAAQGELDAATIQHEGKLKEMSYRMTATSDRMAGRNAHATGILNAAAKLLG